MSQDIEHRTQPDLTRDQRERTQTANFSVSLSLSPLLLPLPLYEIAWLLVPLCMPMSFFSFCRSAYSTTPCQKPKMTSRVPDCPLRSSSGSNYLVLASVSPNHQGTDSNWFRTMNELVPHESGITISLIMTSKR
jgi:hypothetical protein